MREKPSFLGGRGGGIELLSLVQCLLVLVCLAESLPADTKPVTSNDHQAESGIKGAAADQVV